MRESDIRGLHQVRLDKPSKNVWRINVTWCRCSVGDCFIRKSRIHMFWHALCAWHILSLNGKLIVVKTKAPGKKRSKFIEGRFNLHQRSQVPKCCSNLTSYQDKMNLISYHTSMIIIMLLVCQYKILIKNVLWIFGV